MIPCHSTAAVTQNCYIKTTEADAIAAMRTLEYAPNMHLGGAERERGVYGIGLP
jgi:hypothetical protein